MRHKNWGCHPRGRIEIDMPEALFSMGRGRSGGWGPFHFEFDDKSWGGGGGRRGGGRGRRMFESGELRLVLLKLIADEPRHGYELIRAVEELTGGDYSPSPGVVYPTLTMLQDMGLIAEVPGDAQKKVFEATDDGRAKLDEKADEVESLFERLDDAFPKREGKHPPIGRAVGNLMAALRNRIAHDGFDEALVHEITDILDEAAKRIERLKPEIEEEDDD